MEEFVYDIRIPKERVAVLIGTRGEIKRDLERSTKAKLDIDSNEGEVIMKGNDSLILYQLQAVVKAIGRGFNPDIAKMLLKPNYVLELVNMTDFVKDTRGHLERVRGRLIGTEGKARNTIEKLSETFISVYGKTVGVIGTPRRADAARHAVEQILSGSPHANVYKKLEEASKDMKEEDI